MHRSLLRIPQDEQFLLEYGTDWEYPKPGMTAKDKKAANEMHATNYPGCEPPHADRQQDKDSTMSNEETDEDSDVDCEEDATAKDGNGPEEEDGSDDDLDIGGNAA
jgi:hypothetical protein